MVARIAALVPIALVGAQLAVTAASATASTTYTSTETIPVPPAANYAGSGGGDGWAVALSSDQVFNVFHHNFRLTVSCHDQQGAGQCWQDTITDPATGSNFATSGQPGLWLDHSSGKLYVYATRDIDNTGGVVCIDTTQGASHPDPFCGFTALTPVGGAPMGFWGISAISDPAMVGPYWYAFNFVAGASESAASNGLLCFDTETLAACPAQPFYVPFAGADSDGAFPPPAVAAIGNEVIVPFSSGGQSEMTCFDGSTLAACPGSWPVALGSAYSGHYGAPYPLLGADGSLQGFCLPTGADPCYTMAGTAAPTRAGMSAAIGATSGWDGPAVVLGPRVYVPNGETDAVDCFDASTGASCANFPLYMANLGLLYTVNADWQRPSCIWVNSDDGSAQIQNFDAYTGGPCGQGQIRVLASSIVAPGSACMPYTYSSLQVLQPPATAYTSGSVDFEDSDANPIPGAASEPLTAGTADLTRFNPPASAGLPQFLLTLNGTSATPTSVVVELTWTGSADPACTPIGQKPASYLQVPGPTLFGNGSGLGVVTDPVNVVDGNFVDSETDLSFPSSVFGMDWSRTYNSLDPSTGALGTGWSLSEEPSISATPSLTGTAGTVVFTQGDGRQFDFEPVAGGGFSRPAGLYANLVANADGTYSLDYSNGEVDNFNTSGQLSSKADAGGDTVTYLYASGQLSSISSSQGPVLDLSYNAAGQLGAVSSSDGRKVTYSYSTSGSLSGVSNPTGGFETFGDDASGRINSIVDPDGNTVVANTYDSQGRVVSQTVANGRQTNYSYGTDGTTSVTDVASGQTSSFGFDHQGHVTTETDPSGKSSTITYAPSGEMASVRQRDGSGSSQVLNADGYPTSVTNADGAVTTYTYDSSDRVLSVTGPTGATTAYTYSGTNTVPSTITDADGHVTHQTVADNRVLSVTDADGVSESYTYNSLGEVLTDTTAAGTTTYTYDAAGNMTSKVDADGNKTTYAYDAAGDLTSQTSPTGATTTYTYDSDGNQLTQTSPDGGTTADTYDASGNLVSATSPTGAKTTYTYDTYGNLVSETTPNGKVQPTGSFDPLGDQTSSQAPGQGPTSYTFDANGRVTSQTDALGDKTTYSYDPMGQLLSSTDAAGHTTSYTYDGDGRVLTTTNAAGGVTTDTYDPAGLLLSEVGPDGAKTAYAYTPGGRLASATDPLGRTTTYAYDKAGRQVEVTAPNGAVTKTTYDPDGNVVAVTSPTGLVTKTAYDGDGRVVAVTAPNGGVTTTAYDGDGNVISTVGPTGATQSFGYNSADQMTSATAANGAVAKYSYDAGSNLVSVTAANGGVTTYTYNADDQLVSKTDPLGRTTSYTYDALGRVATVTDPTGRVDTRTYDPVGNLATETFSGPGLATMAYSYSYDALGNQTSVSGPGGTTSYTYDGASRLTSETLPTGQSMHFGYDAAGEQTSLTYPDGTVADYSYNSAGELAQVSTAQGSVSYSYNADANLVKTTLPGGDSRTWAYSAGLVSSYSQQVGRQSTSTSIARNLAGQVTSETTNGRAAHYSYDPAGQLTSEQVLLPVGALSVNYTYDADGNRASASVAGVKVSYSYDAANELTSVASPTEAGEAGEGGFATNYTYDAAGRQSSVSTPFGTQATSYDARGQVSSRSTTTADGTTLWSQTQAHDANGNLSALSTTLPGGRSTNQSFVWSPGAVPQVLSTSTTASGDTTSTDMVYGAQRDMAISSGEAANFAYDANGNATSTPQTAGLVLPASYSAFGVASRSHSALGLAQVLGLLGPGVALSDNQAGFGYQGELTTGGLVDLRARDYDPLTGRFTSVDPLPGVPGDVLAANPYPYAGNDPLDMADPLGMHPVNQANLTPVLTSALVVFVPPPGTLFGEPSGGVPESLWVYDQRHHLQYTTAQAWAAEHTLLLESQALNQYKLLKYYNRIYPGNPQLRDEAIAALFARPRLSDLWTIFKIVAPLVGSGAVEILVGSFVGAAVGEGGGAVIDAAGPEEGVTYGAHEAGPLSPGIAATFRGGSYTERVLQEDTTLYRVYGGKAGPVGSFWSADAPTGAFQAQIDGAINPEWGNTIEHVAIARVPAGTTIYEGFAADQPLAGGGRLLGGGSQVYIPNVDPSWVTP
ncbi:MAG TPA: DUF6531 domain-containing protein [Acidimicrobiales bacterium]|nr:DUF6531 domain-containing protein [Acidimicrobiales bacterium]